MGIIKVPCAEKHNRGQIQTFLRSTSEHVEKLWFFPFHSALHFFGVHYSAVKEAFFEEGRNYGRQCATSANVNNSNGASFVSAAAADRRGAMRCVRDAHSREATFTRDHLQKQFWCFEIGANSFLGFYAVTFRLEWSTRQPLLILVSPLDYPSPKLPPLPPNQTFAE